MSCDCGQLGYDEVFDARMARRETKRFLRRGLPKRGRRILGALDGVTPLAGATALEIGAGVGALSIALLERGARRAETIDAVPAFALAARELAAARGVDDRISIQLGDFADAPDAVGPADIVMLDRVICCYPDLEALLRPAAAHARRAIALSYPRDRWWTHLAIRAVNGCQRLFRRRFRIRLHPPSRVAQLLRDAGFVTAAPRHVGFWEILAAARA